MTEQAHPPPNAPGHAATGYSQRNNRAFESELAARTASQEAAFIVPFLRPGIRMLDVGCGPGSITLGLAGHVAPGEIVGVDLQPAQVEQARALAAECGVTNVRFETADVYDLPFPDGSFDAAFAHAVLMHVREPVRALAEIRRVLRPGGVVGLRDPDGAARLHVPTTPLLDQWSDLAERVRQHNGATLLIGRHYRRLLLEAGFVRTEAGASVQSAGSLEETRRQAAFFKSQLAGLARTALAEGWLDEATVEAIAADFDVWAERPDAFYAGIWCEAVGWTADAPADRLTR